MAAVALITGATGLIGRHLLESWDVDGLEPVPVGRERHDLLQPGAARELVAMAAPDVVVHLAWCASGTSDYRDDPRNDAWVAATVELAEACAAAGSRLLATGTSLDDLPADEGDRYARSKVAARRALQPAIDSGEYTWLRPYYVVDPALGRPEVVGLAMRARAAGVPIELRTPEGAHDFVHASDVATAICTVLRGRLGGVVPIGTGVLRSVSDLMTALGVRWSTALSGTTSADPAHHGAADSSRLRRAGWRPTATDTLFSGAVRRPGRRV